jgi:hypothetical protein
MELFGTLGTPLILKEPSTSFSLRLEKVATIEEFFRVALRFIKLSDWIVVQQYVESRYDWRVGVLWGELLYVCKYTIPSVTYKIQAMVNGHIVYCEVESVPPMRSRKRDPAWNRGSRAIGNGLYGWISRTVTAMRASSKSTTIPRSRAARTTAIREFSPVSSTT